MLDLDAIEALCKETRKGFSKETYFAKPAIAEQMDRCAALTVAADALVAELRAARADITEMAYRGTALSGAVDRLEGIVATQAAELRAAREVLVLADGLAVANTGFPLAALYAEDYEPAQQALKAAGCFPAAYRAVVGEQG